MERFIFNNYNSKIELDLNSIDDQLNEFIKDNANFNEYRLSEIEFFAENNVNLNDQVNKIVQFIKDKDFETAVIKFSSSQSKLIRRPGMDRRRLFSKDIFTIIKNLEKGEISKPLIKGNTITLFKLVDKKESSLKNIDKNLIRII